MLAEIFDVLGKALLFGLGLMSFLALALQGVAVLRSRFFEWRGRKRDTPAQPAEQAASGNQGSADTAASASAAETDYLRDDSPAEGRQDETRGDEAEQEEDDATDKDVEDDEEPEDDVTPASRAITTPTRTLRDRHRQPRRARLQSLLNEGYALLKDLPDNRFASSYFTGARRIVRPVDVDMWETSVEAALADHPTEIAIFKYEPPKQSPLFSAMTHFDNPLRDRLKQRLKQLDVVVRRAPRQ